MTTIVYENGVLYSDSLNIVNHVNLIKRTTKIDFNDSKTMAFANTGETTPSVLRDTFIKKYEFCLAYSYFNKYRSDMPKDCLSLIKRYDPGVPSDTNCILMSNEFGVLVSDGEHYNLEGNDFTTIGCYVDSYGIYRRMGLSPIQAYERIFNFGKYTSGPLNIVHSNTLNQPDFLDYFQQLRDGKVPTLNAIPKPIKKTRKTTGTAK